MNVKYSNKQGKKSLQERFLLVLGIFFFFIYLVMGLMVLFWDRLIERLPLTTGYRVTLGIAIIIYAFFRFIRYFKK
ncbi:hypothetical protein [Flavobacterium oreochromis]|uniref:Uncharacterized protein n=2 Tax=Flavobacterium TaxID=237 RepID=A0A246GAP7_9FLAO|nr:hypothetical protein [Flavobacterium oreochromis]OWP77175.1 hypothetical protein BWK62_07925 [Flavobacterium oreochromis]OWP77508.1 hypothetical protein BWG23_05060 [Flavobacterium oreochromis]POR27569.1 hypothetical protein BWK58_04515 [Flavobacterium columnare]QYS87698.1 hypothetical protein JJC03_07920 [Flavobacterium oreochromis]